MGLWVWLWVCWVGFVCVLWWGWFFLLCVGWLVFGVLFSCLFGVVGVVWVWLVLFGFWVFCCVLVIGALFVWGCLVWRACSVTCWWGGCCFCALCGGLFLGGWLGGVVVCVLGFVVVVGGWVWFVWLLWGLVVWWGPPFGSFVRLLRVWTVICVSSHRVVL
ncbi:hypothetical protein, partial [Pseudomonas syringae group genomosp. 7]|uniref:hypothetical protein n=1 Tax=Pseudomonas syringae group genomosp. 7 TaxID=251699 RepID=UPI00376FD018